VGSSIIPKGGGNWEGQLEGPVADPDHDRKGRANQESGKSAGGEKKDDPKERTTYVGVG